MLKLSDHPAPAGDVFITGGSGRIGTSVRQRLKAAGYTVRFTDIVAPSDGDLEGYTRTDLADLNGMTEAMRGCRALIHLGGHPREADWDTINALNFTGTYNALQAARRVGVRTIVYASSNHYCGLYSADTVLAPDLVARPTGLYGASKVFGEGLLRAEAEARGITAFAWRICAFKPVPVHARDLRMWLSLDDSARAVDRFLRWNEPGFNVMWGVSNNTRLQIYDPVAGRIGYQPQDDAEAYVAALEAAGVDTTQGSEWPYLGGEKALAWMGE